MYPSNMRSFLYERQGTVGILGAFLFPFYLLFILGDTKVPTGTKHHAEGRVNAGTKYHRRARSLRETSSSPA